MATEFDDSQHYGIFTTSPTLTSQTGKMVRQSELTLAALRAQGVFDTMVDSTTAPTTDKLWLDKNSDPAVLKEWDSIGSAWVPMTFDRLFGRAIVTELTNVGGTANAITVDAPATFISDRLYSLTPTADNTGATTIQVTGVGTYAAKYHDGTDVGAKEFVSGQSKPLLFANGRFEVIFPVSALYIAAAAAQAAADAAVAAASTVVSTQSSKTYASASYHPTVAPGFIQTAGYAVTGDGGAALYKKVASEPSHDGKFSITLDDGATVAWFEIAEDTIPVKALGAKGDTVNVAATVSITSGTKALTAAGASFTVDDVGKLISIPGAGAAGAVLGSTISDVTDATHVTLADNAGTTLSAVSKTITYGTDNTNALTKALAVAKGRAAFFAPGVYSITKAIVAYSNTTIFGVYGTSIIKPSAKVTGSGGIDGACFVNSTFKTATALDEADIAVDSMAFDYRCRAVNVGGVQVGVHLNWVSRPKVTRCIQWSGGDLTGFLHCADTQTSYNLAYDVRNCAYDHWASTGYVIVSGNIVRSDTVSPGQCIQVTADDTDIDDGSLLGTGLVEKIVITGNIVDVPLGAAHSGIIINCLDGGASAKDAVIGNNYVNGPDYGVVLQGDVEGFVVSANMLRGTGTNGVLTTKSMQGDVKSPSNGVITGNLVADCAAIGIDISYGDDVLVFGNKVSDPATRPIRLGVNSSNSIVKDNMCDDGAAGGIVDLGTNNTVIKIGTTPAKAATNTVFSGSAAPTSFTDLDLSSVVGAKKAFCMARVLNQSGSTASYIFRTNGDTLVEAAPSTAGNGPNICNMQNNEANYVTFITDASGIVEWCSTVDTGTTTINLLSYQPLE